MREKSIDRSIIPSLNKFIRLISYRLTPVLTLPLLALIILAAAVLSGCVSLGAYHTVRKGETMWRISQTYGVDIQELAELNNIRDTKEIVAGKKLYIPGASRQKEVSLKSSGGSEKEREGRIYTDRGRFIWPVKGEVESPFGPRNGVKHEGIDIKAAAGTPVLAAADGEAVFVSEDMRGYGRIIILKHKDNFFTVYGHNKANLIKKGASAKKGDVIAKVGNSGNASNYHLHFEVRLGKTVRNPIFFLP